MSQIGVLDKVRGESSQTSRVGVSDGGRSLVAAPRERRLSGRLGSVLLLGGMPDL